MRLLLHHGTNQAFDAFDPDLLGLANPNAASRAAFFFARREDTAWAYAEAAARKLVPDQATHEEKVRSLLDQAERAQNKGNHTLSEQLYLEAEEMETAVLQAPPHGARVLLCEIFLENPFEIDGFSRDVVTDLGAVLARARAAGHDGVILRGIHDTPRGEGEADDHVAVFDVSRIRILDVLHAPGCAAAETLADPFADEDCAPAPG